ncbi:MAG: GAF domain-containing protein [Bacteroidetes bacterium]|nr:GAF domain-containing protein [Bacteroidota bacterium]
MKLNLKGISAKIAAGYAAIILIAIVISAITFFTIQRLRGVDREITTQILPTYIALKEFSSLNEISFKLSSNWIYQPNQKDKDDLTTLVNKQWPELKSRILAALGTENQSEEEKKILAQFESVVVASQKIMTKLNADSLYSNDIVIDECITILDRTIKPKSTELTADIGKWVSAKNDSLEKSTSVKNTSYTVLTYLVVMSILLYAVIGITASKISTNIIVKPITLLKNLILTLSRGEINDVSISKTNDEIGEMVDSINIMIKGLKSNRDFAVEIGKGNYASEFAPLSEQDQMGNALINMRNNLRLNAEESNRRNWSTAGLAEIGGILRRTDLNSEALYDSIIQFVVKYLSGNQGALFILNDEDSHNEYLELIACYAYNRKKYLHQKVSLGEGLIGQCSLEKEVIYLTQVPQDFVRITSGLGDASPSCILIVPIKINEEVHGVLEIAFFRKLLQHEIEFVQKISESIASTITSVKVADRTKRMVHELQEKSQVMKAQEEEMRQNMEELSATQEEMSRKEKEYITKIHHLEELIR